MLSGNKSHKMFVLSTCHLCSSPCDFPALCTVITLSFILIGLKDDLHKSHFMLLYLTIDGSCPAIRALLTQEQSTE